MGATETLETWSAELGESPWRLLLVACGVLVAVDLSLKLTGISVGFLGGRLTVNRFVGNLWEGIWRGMAIGLAGMGLSMTYSILTFANFSHGDLLTVGGFSGWGVAYLIAGWGAFPFGVLVLVRPNQEGSVRDVGAHILSTPGSIFVGLAVAAVVTAAVALAIDRLVYRRMRDRSGIALLIASVGVALTLRYLIQFVYGEKQRPPTTLGDADVALLELSGVVFGARGGDVGIYADGTSLFSLNAQELTLVIVAVGLMVATHFLLQRTKLGTAMRAMADNKDLALITGIPTERVVTATWLIGGALTGAAGYLLVTASGSLAFNFGWQELLLIFAAVILGGIGSVYGAIAGGLLIGLVFAMSTIWIPSDFNQAAAFAVMILALLFRPEGLFGGVTTA